MFDWYIPEPVLICPHCGTALDEWQGKQGPCALLVWRQGRKHPIDQRIDEEIRWAPEELTRFELAERFIIYTSCCSHDFQVEAVCTTEEGVWSESRIITPNEVDEVHYDEPKQKRLARKEWLQRKTV